MTASSSELRSLELSGLDGTNPLGFLAALGTLVTAHAAGQPKARLRWARARTWVPVLEGLSTSDPTELSEILAVALRGKDVSPEAEQKREAADRAKRDASSAFKKKNDEIKKQRLKGQDRRVAIDDQVRPVKQAYELKRKAWLAALKDAVPRPELALGDRIDCTDEEYREHACAFREGLDHVSREPLDLLSAFGSDACRRERSNAVEPTPFCFIKGSGHQDFLGTVRQLIAKVSPERVWQTLLEPWAYRDPGLSMRWDPIEDKRYALTDIKPADEGASTVWMANLLAYRGLALFSCAPTRRGLGATGWTLDGEKVFTWPIWEFPASPDTVRSLLQLQDLTEPRPDRSDMRARGVAAVFRARRIQFPPRGSNYKLNFSPARAV